MAELPLPKFSPRKDRSELSLDEILAKGREAAAATNQIITGDTAPPLAAEIVPEPVAAAKPDRAAKVPRAKPKAGAKRVRWGTVIRPDLLLGLRRLALERGVSPFDVLEDAVSAYVK